ncbi:hypothetical protein [Streptomyces omiyaensis]|uniref:hypothetical protein n=1 Tax=Streptomyces omiyaensis TaxID=68247 RepID=UPI0036F930F2
MKFTALRQQTRQPAPKLVVDGDPDADLFGHYQECPVCQHPNAILVYDFDHFYEAQRACDEPNAERFECPSCSMELVIVDELAVFGFAADYPGVFDGFEPTVT